MNKAERDLQRKLEAPFLAQDLEWKVQRSGIKNNKPWAMIVPYIAARAVAIRLDEVFGIAGWEVSYRQIELGADKDGVVVNGVVARLRFKVSGAWIVREDAAEPTDIEPVKGGFSGAFKRVAVTLGIGRYLYSVDVGFANITERGTHRGQAKDKEGNRQYFKWDPDAEVVKNLTAGALTRGESEAEETPPPPESDKRTLQKSPPSEDTGPVLCPTCEGPTWDNREDKKSSKAPDYVCKDRKNCDGAIWLDKKPAKKKASAPSGPGAPDNFDEFPPELVTEDDDLPF